MTTAFVGLDVETANADPSSICQIGVVHFDGGWVVDGWQTLVNPCVPFDQRHVAIHGITAATVTAAPPIEEAWPELRRRLYDAVASTHTPFDVSCLEAAARVRGLEMPECRWLDSAAVARRTWSDDGGGFGLAALAKRLGIVFQHHSAIEDARASGAVVLHAMNETGLDVKGWVAASKRKRIRADHEFGPYLERNPAGHLRDHTVAFTGDLAVSRRRAARMAARAGCQVALGVTKKTTALVVGDRGDQFDGESGKERRAEELVRAGQRITLVRGADFLSWVKA
jgi:DNA polymerase-3 subunit epsilon